MMTKPVCGAYADATHCKTMGIVGRWLFNERGTQVTNLVSMKRSPILNGGRWGGSKMGGGLILDGTNDYISTDLILTVSPTSNITLACWYQSTDTDGVLIGTNAITNYFMVDLFTNLAAATKCLVASQNTGSISLTSGKLYFGVAVLKDSVLYHYINGALSGSVSLNGTILSSTTNPYYLRIGERQSGASHEAPAAATIDQAIIANRAWTAGEVKKMYQNPWSGLIYSTADMEELEMA